MQCFAITVFLAVICCSFVCGDLKEEITAMVVGCAKDNEIDQDMIKKIHSDDSAITATDNMKCFTKCLLDKSNAVKDNKLSMDAIEKFSTECEHGMDLEARFEKCKDVYKGAGTCDEAWDVHLCFSAKD